MKVPKLTRPEIDAVLLARLERLREAFAPGGSMPNGLRLMQELRQLWDDAPPVDLLLFEATDHQPDGAAVSNPSASRSGINPSGIFYANFVDANDSTLGDRWHTDGNSTAAIPGGVYPDMPIRVYAGETTVHVINANGDVYTGVDSDGDSLPDSVEDLIIADNPADGITNFAHVGPDDNYDGDELTEILEAAFGTDPTDRDFGVVSIFTDGGDSVVRHPVADLAALNLEVACEYSPLLDPLTWTEDGIPTVTPDDHMEWRLPLVPDPRAFRIIARPAPGP